MNAMTRRLVVAACLLPALSCNDATQNAPSQLNLDRPVDIAFTCVGGLRLTGGGAATLEQEVIVSAQPIESCNLRSLDPPVRPPGQEDVMGGGVLQQPSYYAFILQSTPGTVAVAQFPTKPSTTFAGGVSPNGDVIVLDADPLTPGKNSITVGEDPVAIATDRSGCYEVIANAGSCDLSVLDVNSAIAATQTGSDPIVSRLGVRNGTQQINARPAAMVIQPSSGTIGEVCPAQPTGLAYVAFPSCHLVAGVDIATGTIVTGITFDAAGVPTILTDLSTLSCPSECDGGGAATPGVRPVTLDLEVDARSGRTVLAIGAENSNIVTLYDLDPLTFRPFTLSQVTLQNTSSRPLGVTGLAISPRIGMGGSIGEINDEISTGGEHQFVYAVATDGSVRVVDIEGPARECDAQVDPRYIRDLRDVNQLSCFTVGATTTPPRRASARGPGIELVGDAIPTSVDTFRIEKTTGTGTSRMIGYFGVITATNGRTFIFNIDDDGYDDFVDPASPIATQIPLVIAHQLRDDIPDRGLLSAEGDQLVCNQTGPDPDSQGGNSGGPRLAGNIQRTVPAGAVAAEKFGGLPSLRQVYCDATDPAEPDAGVPDIAFAAPIDVRESVFPDLRALRTDETWNLTWEGSLSLDSGTSAIDGPPVRQSQMIVDSAGMRMVDASRPYCDAGVEPYDVLQLRGCDPALGDAGCPLGYTCFVHPQSQVAGLGSCMLVNEAERLANACMEFLTSLRRYTIGRTRSGEVQMLPRKHVLRTSPISGCTDDNQCQALANYALTASSTLHPVDDQSPVDNRTWVCRADADRRPELDLMGMPLKRCIMACDDSSDCAAGTVCTQHPGAVVKAGYCMEGVVPPQACVNAPQRYELRAGDAFALVGSRSGFVHATVADANGNCVRDPNAHPSLVGRLPLRAPACDPTADPRTGRRTDGTFEPNPCQTVVDQTSIVPNYIDNTCALAAPDELLVTRSATALRLRSPAMTLTVVDPTYRGDLQCHGDRAGSLVDVPLVTPGYQISFRQTAGFQAKFIRNISPSFPIKIARGPGESMWILDQGDFLSTSITQASTRGKVYRVESSTLVINLLE